MADFDDNYGAIADENPVETRGGTYQNTGFSGALYGDSSYRQYQEGDSEELFNMTQKMQ